MTFQDNHHKLRHLFHARRVKHRLISDAFAISVILLETFSLAELTIPFSVTKPKKYSSTQSRVVFFATLKL